MRNFIGYLDEYSAAPFLLNISITGAVVIVIVLIARLFLRRAPKIISYALWLVVLFRLLCPFSLSSDFSVFTLTGSPTSRAGDSVSYMEYVPVGIVHQEYPKVDLPVPGISEVINENLPSGDYQLAADPMEWESSLAVSVWMLGVVIMLFYAVMSDIVLRIRLVGSVPLRENIRLTDRISSPFVFGLILPKIYLPSSLCGDEAEYIILHEKHHIRRGDHIWRFLGFIALSLHWFNPLVWLAFVISGRDMEMSCDEAVIRKLGDDIRADYAGSLLRLSSGKMKTVKTPLAFGENDTKGRIRNIAKLKKPAVWLTVVVSAVCVILAFALLANPKQYDEVIRVDSQYYIRYEGGDGSTVSEIPAGSVELGILESVIHRSSDYPEEDMQAVNIDPKYAGCPIYRSADDPGVIYLYDYSGFYIPFAFTEDIYIREAAGVVYDPTKITLTEAVVGETYVTENCLYMTPLSSFSALGGDSGYRFELLEDKLLKTDRISGFCYEAMEQSEWIDFPWSDEEWNNMFTFGGIRYPGRRYEEIRVKKFEFAQWLMDMDGELWIVDINYHPTGDQEPYIWSIYSLIPASEKGSAVFDPDKSEAFRISFDADFEIISAVCTDTFISKDESGADAGHGIECSPGEDIFWFPEYNVDDAACSVIHFTAGISENAVYAGAVYISRSEDGSYAAEIGGSGLSIAQDGNGAVVSIK